jgi:hypothetical protein
MIIFEPDSVDDMDVYFNYPDKNKVLSGIVFGKKNDRVGTLVPETYVQDYELLKQKSNDKTDMKAG